MLRTTEGIAAGDVLDFWFDTGAFGHQLCYAVVLKACPKMLRVRDEHGHEGLKFPQHFNAVVDAKTVAELRAEGVSV